MIGALHPAGKMEVDAGIVITMDIEDTEIKTNTLMGLEVEMKLVP